MMKSFRDYYDSEAKTAELLEVINQVSSSGIETPYEELCELFNSDTKNGEDMEHLNELLKKAISEIKTVFKRKMNKRLTNNRNAVLIPKTKKTISGEEFELITWLIIR